MASFVRAYNHSFAHAHKPTIAILPWSCILEWFYMHCITPLCAVICKALLENPQSTLQAPSYSSLLLCMLLSGRFFMPVVFAAA
jgi:hypothetical protein